jgi:hypothetical protein
MYNNGTYLLLFLFTIWFSREPEIQLMGFVQSEFDAFYTAEECSRMAQSTN